MKRLYILIILFSLSLNAQLKWRALPSIISNIDNQRFDDVFFLTDNLGWAANGKYAAVYKTIDGGSTWELQLAENTAALPGDYYFRNIEFLNENVGFLGTLNGKFFKTIDGGTNWTVVTDISPNPPAICGLDAVGTATIYGCGAYFTPAYLIKSTDGGITWQNTNMSAYATALVEVLFVDENIGYVSGADAQGGIILKTTDGGISWSKIYNTNIPGEYVWKLQILASNPNVMFGSVESVAPLMGKLIKSTDKGVTWTSKEVPCTNIQGVGFTTETHGWMGGYNSDGAIFPIIETFDSGDTWTKLDVGSNLNRFFIINDHLAYGSGTTIYKFSDENLSNKNFTERNRVPLKATIENNPIKDKLNLSIEYTESDHMIIELYDASGHLIKVLGKDHINSAVTKKYKFDFPYPSGVYIIDLHNNTGRQSIKFMK
jgi:photosystem II stability/assembly factor-like uncharacterized protein